MFFSKKYFVLILAFFCSYFCSCYRVPDQINPRVSYEVQDEHFKNLKNPFPPLSGSDAASDWGREMIIAKAFADELDLYRAISTYKRAKILAPEASRKLEIEYEILLCYFLAKRYDEAIEAFDQSGLSRVDKNFPAYHDLLLILYECYGELCLEEKQERILELLQKSYPETAEKVRVSRAIRTGNLSEIKEFAAGFPKDSYLDQMLNQYEMEKKSVATAQTLNALLPGAGYLYIGQKRSALTAFLLNGLFITAAVEFFLHDHIAAGIITSSFEAGWYFGGIYGAGEEAKYYNERVYEKNAGQVLNDKKLFPVLMIEYGF